MVWNVDPEAVMKRTAAEKKVDGSPVIGSTLLETPVQFEDRMGPELVKLKFHEDGSVTYSRPYGRHTA